MAQKKEIFQPDVEFVKPYFKGNKVHDNYYKALDVNHHVSFHADGYFERPWQVEAQKTNADSDVQKNYYFSRLIDMRRPSESPAINEYRRNRYFPRTRMVCSKVINCLKKIVKSRDWNIDYTKAERPKSIAVENGLEHYCETAFPRYDSVEHWAYKKYIRAMLVDPNAAVIVMPLDFEVSAGEFLRPFPHIVPCVDVYDYVEDKYIVFKSPYKSTYLVKGKETSGKIIMIVTPDEFWMAKQIDAKENFQLEMVYAHGIGELPAWIIGGEEKTTNTISPFYESFIMDMIPALDQAAIDGSDLEAEKSQHLHSTVWIVQTQACSSCSGSGKVGKKGKQTKCPQCEGRGSASLGPYRELIVNLNNILDPSKSAPLPPMGYVTKPTDMVKIQKEIIKEELWEAAAALNMEFLIEAPQTNQSAVAKEVDRTELNNFVYGIAYHLVENGVKWVYFFINEMRYKLIIKDEKVREKMLPNIPVPEAFDILTKTALEDNMVKIAKSNINQDIKELYETQFIQEAFQDDPETRDKLLVAHNHNPLPGMDVATITNLLRAGLCTKQDAVLSTYIKFFISQLLVDDSEFLKKEWNDQHKILIKMAADKMKENDAANDIEGMANDADIDMKIQALDKKAPDYATQLEKLQNMKTGNKADKKDKDPLAGS